MSLGLIDAQAWGGPEDGAWVRCENRPKTVFRKFLPQSCTWEDHIYALEVTEKGEFRLRYICSEHVSA